MSRLPRVLLPVALLLVACLPAVVSADDRGPLTLYFRAAMTIEADGSLSRLEWKDGDKIPAVLRAKLDERVRSWDFEPGTLDGHPARTDTTLNLRLLAEAREGGLALTVQGAKTGASLGPVMPPAFPRRALRAGEEAAVLAKVAVAVDGETRVTMAGYHGDERWRDVFVEAVEGMFSDLTVQYEQVGGMPAPAEFSVPVEFCLGAAGCDEHDWQPGDGTTATAPGAPMPAGSVARLVTDVRGTSI